MRNPRSAVPLALALALLGSLVLAAAAAAAQPPIPIPGPLDGPLPRFTGAAVEARPLASAAPPRNPALRRLRPQRQRPGRRQRRRLAVPRSARERHHEHRARCSSAPARRWPSTRATACSRSATARSAPSLRLIDPETLATIATLSLPNRPGPDRTDLAGGTHLIVRGDGTLLVPTNRRTLLEVDVGGASLRRHRRVDLERMLAAGERPVRGRPPASTAATGSPATRGPS